MTLNYNVTGPKRKELVTLIADFTGCDTHYKSAPNIAYEVDYFSIDRKGAGHRQAPSIGTKGTVLDVDDIGSIMVAWDSGGSLSVVWGEDICHRI